MAPALSTTYAIPQVQSRFDKISDPYPSATAVHDLGFTYTDLASVVGSISFEYCSNSPILGDPCIAPNGLDVDSVVLSNQTGEVGFAINSAETTASKIVISRSPLMPGGATATSEYHFSNVTNPSDAGSHYVRIQTFSSTDATGPALEDGGVVFALVPRFDVSAEVPPYLLLCAAVTISGFDCTTANSFFIDMGEFSRTQPKAASSEIVSATNAGSGFAITLSGTTLTSGNNIIPALTTNAPSNPGTSQFGLNLSSNSSPAIGANPSGPGSATSSSPYSIPNQFRFAPGDVIAGSPTTSDKKKFTVSYLANVAGAQEAGVYTTTVSFIALANF